MIPAGGLSADHSRWIQPRYPFFLPIKVLSRLFRGKFVAGLRRAFQQGKTRICHLQPSPARLPKRSGHLPLERLRSWNKKRKMTLTADEFLRRFLLHILPKGFVRIRFFGFLANRRRAQLLPICRQLLAAQSTVVSPRPTSPPSLPTWSCPICGGPHDNHRKAHREGAVPSSP